MGEKSDSPAVNSEQNEIFRALERSRKEARLWKNKYDAAMSGKNKGESAPNQENQAQSQPQVSQITPESTKQHSFKAWQAACTNCGEKNPDFKPETKCVNCNTITGAIEVAKKMDFCPGCGEKLRFAPTSKEAEAKFEVMFPNRGPT